ncbi:MAG: response regulator [Oscillospiraceae bacterium]
MKRTILVVDDNNVNRMMLHGILGDEYEILEAETGWNAMNILSRKNDGVSAILLDILMPIMDGYEFLEKVKADPELAKIPVLVVTQLDDEASETKALSLGAVDFLHKPYQNDILRYRLRNIIQLSEQ